ncbi:hypothetical protein LIER_08093 [Lithospermum erythrorhizon]|uniref:RNase H type-1 domain-containing protein n=1 Tax=Lithospermum erythrorhizon TaxID=34254 RepID=A0AAV3PDF7_LITER
MQHPKEEVDSQSFDWSLHVDGARNDKGAGASMLITGPQRLTMEYALTFSFPATNNEAEYEAMILRLKLVNSLSVAEVLVKGGSKLGIYQIQGKCGVNSETLKNTMLNLYPWLKVSRGSLLNTFRENKMKKQIGCQDYPQLITTTYPGVSTWRYASYPLLKKERGYERHHLHENLLQSGKSGGNWLCKYYV